MSQGFIGRWARTIVGARDAVAPERDEAKTPLGVQQPPVVAESAPSLNLVVANLLEPHRDELPKIARRAGVTTNTLVRALAGQGIKLETLDKLARAQGWTVTILGGQGHQRT